MKKLLQKTFKKLSMCLIIIGLFSSKSSAQLGSGWGTPVTLNQQVQLENYKLPAGDNTPFDWPITNAYINSTGAPQTSDNTSVTSKYNWNSSSNRHTFTLKKYPGNRSEQRVFDTNSSQRNYTSGTRQFEGYVTFNSNVWEENAVVQLFGHSPNATLMQIRADGSTGELNVFQNGTNPVGNRIIAENITNTMVKINIIHIQQTSGIPGKVYIFVEDELKFSFSENLDVENFFKYGCYGRKNDAATNGITNAEVKWENVKYWKGGTFSEVAIPNAPSNLTATAASSTSVNLSWNDNSNNESKFSIQYSQNGGAFTGIGAITPNNQNPAANTTSYTVTNLAPNTSYVFRIRSENTGGKSAYATSSTVTTPPAIVYYKIKVLNNPTFVLNSSSTTPVSGTNVNVFTSSTSESQLWQLIPTSNGYVRIVPKLNPNLVLAPISATLTNGVDVRLDTWASFNRQQWLITPLNNGTGASKIEARLNGTFVLDCSGTPENNRNVQVWTYAPNNRQQWIVEPVPGGGIASINQNGLIKLESFSPTSSKLSLNFYVSTNSLNSSIRYSVPEAGNISLELFDVSGQRIKVLDTGFKKPNTYNIDFNSTGLTKGIYLLKLSSKGEVKTEKIIVN